MRIGEFQCIFGSDQAVVKLEFRERISRAVLCSIRPHRAADFRGAAKVCETIFFKERFIYLYSQTEVQLYNTEKNYKTNQLYKQNNV
jgi:hypothetical protein